MYELAAAGKYDVALKIIKKAVEDNPGDVCSRSCTGSCCTP